MTAPLVFAALALTSLITSFISGILGMAGGMILMGVLLVLLPLSAAMMLHGIVQFASNGWRALMLFRHIDWRVVGGYVAGALLTLAIFVWVRLVIDKAMVLLALGAMPYVTLALPASLKLSVERRGHSFVCGLVCSTLSLTAGLSGPILDVFFVRSPLSRHSVIATKAVSQCLSHALKVIYFGGVMASGDIGVEPWQAVAMVALAFVGTTLSKWVLEKMTDQSFRDWTRLTVLTMGGIYFASGLSLLLD